MSRATSCSRHLLFIWPEGPYGPPHVESAKFSGVTATPLDDLDRSDAPLPVPPPPWRQQVGTRVAGWARLLTRPPRWTEVVRAPWRVRQRLLTNLAILVAVVALAMAVADTWAITYARERSPELVATFHWITQYGLSGYFLWPLGLMLIAAALAPPRRLPRFTRDVFTAVMVRISFLFLAIALPGLVVSIVKRLIGRARPFVPDNVPDAFLFHPFGWASAYASFPSGHSTTAFSALIAFGALWPALRPLLWMYALLIALSRVMVVAHHPSDVIAGAAFGAVGALLVRDWFAERRLAFLIAPDGRVLPMSGPTIWRVGRLLRAMLPFRAFSGKVDTGFP